MDDEDYFTFDGSFMLGNDNFYSDDRGECPDDVSYVGLDKFPKKLLVSIAISSKGVSEPLFRPTKSLTINSMIYINEFLERVLLRFINEHHSDGKYIFWPDLVRVHYSEETQAWLNGKVTYVPKYLNPSNVRQARPI